MLVPIGNTPRAYAWGSAGAIAELLGREPSGAPEAELWFGAHPGSPAAILRDDPPADNLAEWIASDPKAALGDREQLPFLLKVLAADSALSLQAHPTPEQAVAGFARENAQGIPLDAPHRNYKDANAKPEVIYALSETFDALCGFRSLEDTRALFQKLGLESLVPEWASIRALFAWLLSGDVRVSELVDHAVGLEGNGDPELELALDTIRALAEQHPGDPGIVAALLLNRVQLTRGEALYLPAGNIHAYLRGVGMELMEASDNVLRGGLTTKHIDVPELLAVLDFAARPIPRLAATELAPGLQTFHADGCDFQLVRVTGDAVWRLGGPAIALCLSGAFAVDSSSTGRLARGEAMYVTPDEGELHFRGEGELFLATTGDHGVSKPSS